MVVYALIFMLGFMAMAALAEVSDLGCDTCERWVRERERERVCVYVSRAHVHPTGDRGTDG